eukprot:jgi/Tetstr1/446121/TSEL_033721.t1
MAAAGADPTARVAQLEDELATVRAQTEASMINWEQATQAMEQRYSALSEEFDKGTEAKEKLRKELEAAKQELGDARAETHRLQTQVVAKDTAVEQQTVRAAELHSDVQRLLRVSEQKDAQLAEQQELVAGYLKKVQEVTSERVELGARLAAAERISSQAGAVQERLAQEKANLEKHNQWLVEELDRKSDDLLAQNRSYANQLGEARSELQTAKARITELEISEGNLKHKVESLNAEFESVQRRTEQSADEASSRLTHLMKELETSNRLAELRKQSAEEAKGRVAELEGILREITERMEAVVAAKDDELAKADEVRVAVEAECNRLRESVRSMMTAAQTGQHVAMELDFGQAAAGVATPGAPARTPGSLTPPTPSVLGSGLSAAELYSKYAEKDAECRRERQERRRVEQMMDEMVRQVEIRAAHMQEQKAEYGRVMASYQTLQENLQAADDDRRRLEAEKGQLNMEIERLEKERGKSEQNLKDCSAQLQRMIWENQELRQPGAGGAAPSAAASAAAAGSVTGAGDVISEHLVTFATVKELEQKNKHLLALTRDLSSQLEEQELKAQEKLDAELNSRSKNLQAQLEQLTASRKRQQELVEQIIRQRDLYKSMLEQAGRSVPPLPTPPAAGGPSQEAAAPAAELLALPAPGAPDYKALYTDLTAELEKVRKENAENASMQQQEKASLRDELARLKVETERAQATATFERERYQRLIATSDAHRKELEAILSRNAEVTALLTERERKLREAAAEVEAAQSAARREREKATALAAEKAILVSAEGRASAEATELTKEKFRLAATLEANSKLSQQQLEENMRERERLNAEVKRMTAEWSDIQKVLATEKAAAASAAHALDALTKESGESKRKFEAEVRSLRDEKASAEQRAAVAEGKVEVITNSLKKAEERAASLARSGGAGSSGGSEAAPRTGGEATAQHEAQLATEMVILRQELAAAQEAAAAAMGHVEQYKAIANSSDDALRKMQESHEAFKAEAEKATAAAQQAADDLRAKLDASEGRMAEARGAQKAAEEKLADLEGAIERETASLKEKLVEAEARVAAQAERVSALERDVEQHHKNWRMAQQLYEQELVNHADKVKALNEAEAAQDTLKAKLETVEKGLDEARNQLAAAISDAQAATAAKEAAEVAAESRVADVSAQNAALHEQLEKMAAAQQTTGGDSGAGGGSLAEVVKYLRREKETAECQLALMQQEAKRWQQQAAHSDRAAAQARQQLESSLQRSRADVAAEGEHRELMEKVQHLNLLRESNVVLRAECESHAKSYQEAKRQLEDANKKVEEASGKMRAMQAEVAAKDSELAMIKEEAKRWETRSQQLLQKYKSVDPKEHQRVCDQLKSAQESLANAQGAVDAKKAAEEEVAKLKAELGTTKATLEKSQQQERLAKKQIMTIYNPGRLPVPKWRKEREDAAAKLKELEAALAKSKEESAKPAAAGASANEARAAAAATAAATAERDRAKEEASKAEAAVKAAEAARDKLVTKVKALEQRQERQVEMLRKAKLKVNKLEGEVASRDESIAQMKSAAAAPNAAPLVDVAPGDKEMAPVEEAQPATAAPLAAPEQPAAEATLPPAVAKAEAAAPTEGTPAAEADAPGPEAPVEAEADEREPPPPAKRTRLNADAPPFPSGVEAEAAPAEAPADTAEGDVVMADGGAEEPQAEAFLKKVLSPEAEAVAPEAGAEAEEGEVGVEAEEGEVEGEAEEGELAEGKPEEPEAEPAATEGAPPPQAEPEPEAEAEPKPEPEAEPEGEVSAVEGEETHDAAAATQVTSPGAATAGGGGAGGPGGGRKTLIQWPKPTPAAAAAAAAPAATAPAPAAAPKAAVPPKAAPKAPNPAASALAAAAAANASLGGAAAGSSAPDGQAPSGAAAAGEPSPGRAGRGRGAAGRGRGKRGRGAAGRGAARGGAGRGAPPP